MYYLLIEIAHPDYKRPYSDTSLYFFENIGDAEEKLSKVKTEYIEDQDLRQSNDELITIDKFDEMLESGKLGEIIYNDSYMDQPPFYSVIAEVLPSTK